MTIHHMCRVQQLAVVVLALLRSTTTRKKCSSNVVAFCRLTSPSRFAWLWRSVVSRRDPVINCSWNMWISSMFRQSWQHISLLLYHEGKYVQTAASTHSTLEYVDITINIAVTIPIITIIITNKIVFQSKEWTGQTEMLFCSCDLDLITMIY